MSFSPVIVVDVGIDSVVKLRTRKKKEKQSRIKGMNPCSALGLMRTTDS